MENLIKRVDDSIPSVKENEESLDLIAKSEFGACIKFKNGKFFQLYKKMDESFHLIEHVPFFEFENEEDLYKHLPIIHVEIV